MKDLLDLRIQKKINPDYLIYKYKTKRISPEDFGNFQNPIDLFKDLRDGNINPKKVLKNQINFKSDLDKMKIWKSEIKIRRSSKCNISYIVLVQLLSI